MNQCLPLFCVQLDFSDTENVPGFIHAMALNKDGTQMAVSFGETAKLALITLDAFGELYHDQLNLH